MIPVLAKQKPQYSLNCLRLDPEAGLRSPTAHARLEARSLPAYVRGPAEQRKGGARESSRGGSHGGCVGFSLPTALHGVAGGEAQRLSDLPAWLRWTTVFRPGYCSMGNAPPDSVPPVLPQWGKRWPQQGAVDSERVTLPAVAPRLWTHGSGNVSPAVLPPHPTLVFLLPVLQSLARCSGLCVPSFGQRPSVYILSIATIATHPPTPCLSPKFKQSKLER